MNRLKNITLYAALYTISMPLFATAMEKKQSQKLPTSIISAFMNAHIANYDREYSEKQTNKILKFFEKNKNNTYRDERGESPLHYACAYNNYKVTKYLLENKANLDLQDNYKITPIDCAYLNTDTGIIKLIFGITKRDINHKDRRSLTILHHACKNGNTKLVKYLLKKGAKIDITDNDNNTPLHLACDVDLYNFDSIFKKIDILKPLVKFKALLNAQNNNGNTPLHLACKNQGILKGFSGYLIKNHANTEIKNNDGDTPIELGLKNARNCIIFPEYLSEYLIGFVKPILKKFTKMIRTKIKKRIDDLVKKEFDEKKITSNQKQERSKVLQEILYKEIAKKLFYELRK